MNMASDSIKKLRKEKKMTQDELAEKLCVTRQAVSNWAYVIYYIIKY